MPNTAGPETRDPRRWTRDMVLALPDDGRRYELVDGELLVTPAPRGLHQRAVLEMFRRLDPYVRMHHLGAVCLSPADLTMRTGQLVQPDLFVGALVDGREPVEWEEFGVPVLVGEILSPSTARPDRIVKRQLYQRVGVGTCWLVNLDARLVEVWTPGAKQPVIADRELIWQPERTKEALVVELDEFFDNVSGR